MTKAEPDHREQTTEDRAICAPDSGVGIGRRRAALALGAGVVAAVFAGGLSACGGRKRDLVGTTVGQPIPPDPKLVRTRPWSRPVWTPEPIDPAPTRTPATRSLSVAAIDRSHWTRTGPNARLANPMRGVARITVHHDGISSAPTGDWGNSVRRLESIRRSHVNNGWADIGYHYAVDPNGRVWSCRPLALQGAHVSRTNEHNIGILVMGNFEHMRPTPQAAAALEGFIGSLIRTHGISEREVYTHRELKPTACPGRYLQAHMNAARATRGRLANA